MYTAAYAEALDKVIFKETYDLLNSYRAMDREPAKGKAVEGAKSAPALSNKAEASESEI